MMEWYNVLIGLIGLVGGGAGFISIYKAKSEKTTIDVGNMQTMLDEAHKMYDEMREQKDSIDKDFHDYKAENMKYVAEFKERFAKLEQRLDKAEDNVLQLKGAIYQGYRCKLPATLQDCPVVKEYEKLICKGCDKNGEE